MNLHLKQYARIRKSTGGKGGGEGRGEGKNLIFLKLINALSFFMFVTFFCPPFLFFILFRMRKPFDFLTNFYRSL